MAEVYAAFCNNRSVHYSGDGFTQPNGIEPGIRRGDGSGAWTLISQNLNEHVCNTAGEGLDIRWAVMDMYFIKGSLWVLWYDDYTANGGCSVLTGSTWHHIDTYVNHRYPKYTGFFCWNRKPYIYGTTTDQETDRAFSVFEIKGTDITPYAVDRSLGTRIYQAWRGCAFISPTIPNTLVVGDAWNDQFAYVDLLNKTFHQGSTPGGSCIFSMGVDNNKVIWTGDYANFYYKSSDGGLTFHLTGTTYPEDGPDTGLCEAWEMKRWKNTLYGVGCNPCSIIKRNEATDSRHFDVVATYPELGHLDGTGFMSFQPVGSDLVIGFGSEPFYYQNRITGAGGTVYRYSDSVLHNIGGGLNWGDGVHQVCDRTRSCSPNVITGEVGEAGVRYDNSTDTSSRMLARS